MFLKAEHLLSQARACYIDLHRATARERYERLLQRCPGIVEHLDLQDIASFLRPVGSKRQSRAPERHSQDHQHDPKGYHFRQGLATDFTKTLNLGKDFHPRRPVSGPCRGLFCVVFCNFACVKALCPVPLMQNL